MSTIVKLKLREDAEDADDNYVLGYAEDIDLDALTPRARALAECVAQMPGAHKGAGDILCEHTTLTRREMTTHPEVWLRPEEMDQPARQTWARWDKYPAHSETPAIEYLERHARKIPPDWIIVSATVCGHARPGPVPSKDAGAADRHLTRHQVLDYMRARGRDISASTWSAYTSRKRQQAPPPDRYVGRTPMWKPETIDAFLDGRWKAETPAT